MRILLPFIHRDGKISYDGIDNAIFIKFADGGFQTVYGVKLGDGYIDLSIDKTFKVVKFLYNSEPYEIYYDEDKVIFDIPERIEPPVRETIGVGKITDEDIIEQNFDAVIDKTERRIVEATVRGINIHRMHKALDSMEDFVDDLMSNIQICYDINQYPNLDVYLTRVRCEKVKPVDGKVCISYSDYERAYNILQNYIPVKYGINPVEVFLSKGKPVRKYDFSSEDMFRKDSVSLQKRTNDLVDISALGYRDIGRDDTIHISWVIIFALILRFLASTIGIVPLVGPKLRKFFGNLAAKFMSKAYSMNINVDDVIDGIEDLDEVTSSLMSEGSDDSELDSGSTGGSTSGTEGSSNNFDNNMAAIGDESDRFLKKMENIMGKNLENDILLKSAQIVMKLYKKGVLEQYPEKYAALIYKENVDHMRDRLAFLTVYDFWAYPDPVRITLQNDIATRPRLSFNWIPVLEYIYYMSSGIESNEED